MQESDSDWTILSTSYSRELDGFMTLTHSSPDKLTNRPTKITTDHYTLKTGTLLEHWCVKMADREEVYTGGMENMCVNFGNENIQTPTISKVHIFSLRIKLGIPFI